MSDSLETQAVSTPSEPNKPNAPTYRGDFEFPVTVELGPGLEGAITNKTKIGYVDGQAGRLVYRGYSIEDLTEHSTYEETAYLLVFGRLPTTTSSLSAVTSKASPLEGSRERVMLSFPFFIPAAFVDVCMVTPRLLNDLASCSAISGSSIGRICSSISTIVTSTPKELMI